MRALQTLCCCGFFALGFSGCGATDQDFARARSADTSEAYAGFLSLHPSSQYRAQAEKHQGAALWRETEAAGTASAYLAFLKSQSSKNPKSADAKERCRKLLVEGKGAEGDYLDFLYRFSGDPSAGEMRKVLAKVRHERIKDSRDPEVYASYIAQYPGTPEAAKFSAALQRRDFLEAEKTGTRLAYHFFLKRHPSSADAGKAKAQLERFGAPARQEGDSDDVEKLLPRLRRASKVLVRRECRNALSEQIARQKDLYGSPAEDLRNQLRFLADEQGSLPGSCDKLAMTVPAAQRKTAANAVHALGRLMQRQQELASVFSGSDKVVSEAREIGGRAAALAEESETEELEIEALYGSIPADPKRPDDTASKNAREAERRAKRAWELARGGRKPKKEEAAEVLRLMDRQAELLIEIIASLEKPAASGAAADEGGLQ